MSAIEPLLRQPAAHAIAWALLQFVWQGALIGALTAVALAALKRSAADVRYVVATIALSLMLTMPVVTAVQSWRASSAPVPSEAATSFVLGAAAGYSPPAQTRQGAGPVAEAAPQPSFERVAPVNGATLDRASLEPWLPALLLAWLTGVSLLTLRLMSGWLWVQRLKAHGAAPDEAWQRAASRLCRRLHVTRGVRLLDSSLVEVPTVIGWMKPVILMPGSVVAGLSPQQLEAILAHELAHIRRHDYLVNLLQTLVETLLFYHPAVWWLSRRIRMERENCCDDLAVSLCGDPYTYAQALADLEERRGAVPLALAATGGSLLQRVRRLLGASTSHAGRGPGWLAGTAALLVMGGIVGGALGRDIMRAQQSAPEATASMPAAAAAPVVVPVQPRPATATRGSKKATESELVAVSGTMRSVAASAPEPATRAAFAAVAAPAAEAPSAVESTAAALAHGDRDTFANAAPVLAAAQGTVGNFTWSHNGDKLEVTYRGEVEFTDDDTDVKRLSPGGYLKIKDSGWLGGRSVEFRADASGNIQRRFWVGTSERPFEPEGRQWLGETLPRFIRASGLGAQSRVARILKAGGPSAVLAEIRLISGSWAKRVYFRELLRQASLDSPTAVQVLQQIGREVDSDFERASLLIEGADTLLRDDPTRKAYFEAVGGIKSDFEMRRVYSSALKRGPVSAPLLAGILDSSRSIESDFELASLLVQIVQLQPLDDVTRRPFFAALGSVDSDFEHRRVLSAVAARNDLTPATVEALIQSASTLQSDFELASLLTQVAKDHAIEGSLRGPFFRAVDSIESAFERARVLQIVAKRPDVSAETVIAILNAVQGIRSSHEASRVLLTIAAGPAISGRARDLYIDAAEKLGEFEQGRALTALVRNERRR